MSPKPLAFAAALLACALSAAANAADPPARPPPEEALPGVDLENLSPPQRAVLADLAASEFCYCGCPHTVATCLKEHGGCKHARRMMRLASRYAAINANKQQIAEVLDAYYASFDRRVKLDTSGFGPPLGDAAAPVTLVEFSDFGCPFCGRLRPVLEKLVADHPGRVKLFYKPFPLQSHPGAHEAAQAAEWAREHGIFWPMHDLLYERAGSFSPEALAGYARQLGGDPDSLRAALESGTYRAKIEASRREGIDAGLRATPTLYIDGRKMALPDLNEETLRFTLEDEEEWKRGGRWERD
jgi:protein-disulfide isomerase